MTRYYYEEIERLLAELSTTEAGLSIDEAEKRLKRYGPNLIQKVKKTSPFVRFFSQFKDFLILILIAAATFSLYIGATTDAILIYAITLINAFIGFYQEYRAEMTIEALKKYLPQTATVLRNNEKAIIEASQLVPGDIVFLSEGNKVAADMRLLLSNELFTNDSAFTGESEPQVKKVLKVENNKNDITDIEGTVFAGSQIISGNGMGIVIATGMETQIGKIAKVTQQEKEVMSPLQEETKIIGKKVAKLFVFVSAFVFAVYYFTNDVFNGRESLLFSIEVAAAVIPEGLPATISVALAIGAQKIARRKAAVKKLSTVETLGEVDVIVTDKTGTLTKNEMTVSEIYCNRNNYNVSGSGYTLAGEIEKNGISINPTERKNLNKVILSSIFPNNATINTENKDINFLGDPTDIALLVAAEKFGIDTFTKIEKAIVTEEIPFTSERKFMAKTIREGSDEVVYFKGATSKIISMCSKIQIDGKISNITKKDILDTETQNEKMSSNALRVIACAYKTKDKFKAEKNLIFLGLFGIADPPRPDVKEALAIAHRAGIRTIMVTGDHGLTAAAIAKKIKLCENPRIITGEELNNLHDGQLKEILREENIIFARVDPIHKLRITKTLRQMGKIVCVTGDGVNDSPALKTANVGVSMGIAGTDVSKEASAMVLLDDNYSSIVAAIREGRVIYDNIEKFTKFEFTTNAAEFTAVIAGLIFGISPLLAIQILLMDFGAETFTAFALAVDKEDGNVMERKPRNRNIRLLNPENIAYILRNGITMGVFAIIAFCLFYLGSGWLPGEVILKDDVYRSATTVTYLTIALSQILHSYSIRSKTEPFYRNFFQNRVLTFAIPAALTFIILIIYVPTFSNFARMAPLGPKEWLISFALSGFYLTFLEFSKLFKRNYQRQSLYKKQFSS